MAAQNYTYPSVMSFCELILSESHVDDIMSLSSDATVSVMLNSMACEIINTTMTDT